MNGSPRPRVLMPVFNAIDFDGRVQRAAEALSAEYDVTVAALDAGRGFRHPAFATRLIALPDGLSKAGKHLRFGWEVLRLARELQPRIVHAHDFFMALPGWLAAGLTGSLLVYDAHEIMIPDPVQRHTPRERLFYMLERFAARRADLTISVSEEAARLLQRCYGLRCRPMVVPNQATLPSDIPDRQTVAETWPNLSTAPDRIRLIYAGDMDRRRGIADFIVAMPGLDRRHELVLAGEGCDLAELQAMARKSSASERIHFLGRVSRPLLFALMRTGTIGIVAYAGEILAFKYGSSNKIFEYQLAGMPLLVTRRPGLERALAGATSCRFIRARGTSPADRTGEIVAAVHDITEHLDEMRAGIAPFLAAHDQRQFEERLRKAYSAILQGRGP